MPGMGMVLPTVPSETRLRRSEPVYALEIGIGTQLGYRVLWHTTRIVASPKQDKLIKVFLVDDHPIVREGVRDYLTHHAILVVGDAGDAKEALRKVTKANPDVVVLDVNLPGINGGELARRLRRLIPKARLIAFSIHSSEEYVVGMARCGVHGYVTKDQPATELLAAIKDVSRGGLHFPAGMSDALLAPGLEFLHDRRKTAPRRRAR
jgi:DNA-binding NarL/FixJ family response regulator